VSRCWRTRGAGLAFSWLLAILPSQPLQADEGPDVQQQIQQLQQQLNAQKSEIERLNNELSKSRQPQDSFVRRVNSVSPALFQVPEPETSGARSGVVGEGLGSGGAMQPETPSARGGAVDEGPGTSGAIESIPSTPRAGVLSVGPEELGPSLPETYSAREGAIGVGPGTSGAITQGVGTTPLERYLKGYPDTAGYDKAFFIRNPNGPEILYFSFKSQNWYDHIDSNPNNPPLGSSMLTPRQSSSTDTIRFRREELHLFGNITDHIGFKVMVDYARAINIDETTNQTNRILQDVFLTYTPKPWLGFRFGQFRVPMTMEGFWQDSGNLDFPEETLMTRSYGDVRDAGLMALGKPFDGIIEYYIGTFSGARQNRLRDENSAKDMREWLAIHPLARFISTQNQARLMALKQDPSSNPVEPRWKELMVGASRRDGIEGSDPFGRFHGDSTNVFGDIEYGRFVLRGEWSEGRGLNARSVSFDPNAVHLDDLLTKNGEGWYVTLGYNLNKKWRPIVRYEEFRRDIHEPNNTVRITTLGVNYFINGADDYNRIGAHRMLIQAAYNLDHSEPNAHYFAGNEFTTNFQMSF